MTRSIFAILFCSLTLCALAPHQASAQALLKVKGQNAVPLRLKALRARTVIQSQFASTNLTLTYMNESSDRVEADFLYTLPNEAVATYFAYWYGDEKVVARIVEKERAAAIYEHITSRMHDPALIEMVGKNTFRARIFPVMPNADLKVEIRIAQALRSTARGALFTLPLRTPKGEPLESVDVRVDVKPDPTVEQVTNNLGIHVARHADGYGLSLKTANLRPQRDLSVQIIRKSAVPRAALFAARSGGEDGFFALALTPDRALVNPSVKISVLQTYDVVPARVPDVRAGHALLVFGRYRGSGDGSVTFTGKAASGPWFASARVRFGEQRMPDNVAMKLWAASRIEQLSRTEGNREAVLALCHQYTLPSKYASWLAIPQEELTRYRREKARADLELMARQIAKARFGGRPSAARVADLRRRMAVTARRAGMDPEEARDLEQQATYPYLMDQMGKARTAYVAEIRKGKPGPERVHRLLQRLLAVDGEFQGREYAEARAQRLTVRVDLQKLKTVEERADPAMRARLARQREALLRREDELRVRFGDPLISVEAPRDALQVVAIMPDGTLRPLVPNPATGRWEARFDVPAYARQGEYVITVVVVLRNGSRRTIRLTYHVDLTSPHGAGSARMVAGAATGIRLEVTASETTARVVALLPWGARIPLQRMSNRTGFLAVAPVPAVWRRARSEVTYIMTDRAHNRTSIAVDTRR